MERKYTISLGEWETKWEIVGGGKWEVGCGKSSYAVDITFNRKLWTSVL